MPLPRTIWMLWLQGWSEAPEIVRACLATWRSRNPGWEVSALTEGDLDGLIGGDPLIQAVCGKPIDPQARANIVRTALLRRYGGVWADATLFCLHPLDCWLETPRGFFAFDRPGPDRMLSNWFIAAEPGCYLIEEWAKAVEAYWRPRDQKHTYFWHHYLFADRYHSDPRFKANWDATPKISADGPHCFLPYDSRLSAPVTEAERRLVEQAEQPVLKLTHKVRGEPGSVYDFLCKTGARGETT